MRVSTRGTRCCTARTSPGLRRQRRLHWNSIRLRLSIDYLATVVCAGDWVRMGQREHGAKGLCQERAYVCGLEAANSLLRREVVRGMDSGEHRVIPIRPDEPQVVLGRALNKLVMDPLEAAGLRWPWLAGSG